MEATSEAAARARALTHARSRIRQLVLDQRAGHPETSLWTALTSKDAALGDHHDHGPPSPGATDGGGPTGRGTISSDAFLNAVDGALTSAGGSGEALHPDEAAALLHRFGDWKGRVNYGRFWRALEVDAPTDHTDPELLHDTLPQPYRMIVKLLEVHVLDASWDVLCKKHPEVASRGRETRVQYRRHLYIACASLSLSLSLCVCVCVCHQRTGAVCATVSPHGF